MTSYDELYENICRLCLSYHKSNNMVNLIDDLNNLNHYGQAVLTFANINICSDDDLPTKMCSRCLFILKQAFIFKMNCESSDNQLKKLKKLSNSSLESFKEMVVQHWMYKLYFPTKLGRKPCQETYQQSNHKNDASEVNKRHLNRKQSTQSKVVKCNNIYEHKSDKIIDDNLISDINSCEQTPRAKTESNYTQNVEQLLDIIENMIGTQAETLFDDDFKQCKKKKLIQSRKLLKHNQTLIKSHKIHRNKLKKSLSLECRICRKVLANPLTYRQHMQRHTGCRYICEHCGKGFPVRAELNIHRVARHGTGPYLQCKHCSFKAPRKFDLVEHERVHTGERPYTCDKCGFTFRRRGIWRRHMIYHTEKNVQCTQCQRKFYQRSAMLAHVNNVHDRIYVYLCSKCGVTYAKPATVRRHLTERHGIPREMQGKVMRVNKAPGCNTL